MATQRKARTSTGIWIAPVLHNAGFTISAIRAQLCCWCKAYLPRVVMEVLGHSQISLTMNTYTHVLPELRRQAADRMEELIAEGYETEPAMAKTKGQAPCHH